MAGFRLPQSEVLVQALRFKAEEAFSGVNPARPRACDGFGHWQRGGASSYADSQSLVLGLTLFVTVAPCESIACFFGCLELLVGQCGRFAAFAQWPCERTSRAWLCVEQRMLLTGSIGSASGLGVRSLASSCSSDLFSLGSTEDDC